MRLRLKEGEFIFKMTFSLSSPSSMLIKALITGEGGGGGGYGFAGYFKTLDRSGTKNLTNHCSILYSH